MGIRLITPAKILNHTIDKFVQITSEVWKGFNRNGLLYNSSGDDSPPCKDDQIILVKIDGSGKYIALGVLTVSQGAKPGERIIYARDADAKVVSKISMLNDGTVKLENDKDIITVTEGDRNETVKGDTEYAGEGKLTVIIRGDMTFDSNGKIIHRGKSDITEEATGRYTIKGAQVEISGDTELVLKTIGSSMWCPNGQQVCLFCGSPHGGPAMGVVGLKGS